MPANTINLIDLYINDEVFAALSEEARKELRTNVMSQVNRLKQIKEEINKISALQKKIVSRRSQLHYVLGAGTSSGVTLNYQEIGQDMAMANKIGPLIYEAYHLTSQILQDLKIIPAVKYTFTYQGKDSFARATDITINPDTDLTYEIHRNTLTIRLKQSELKHKILMNQQAQGTAWVSEHYSSFIEPLRQAERKGKFKLNYGVASEAFERHWEELNHQFDQPRFDNFGSIGHIWYLYRMSSGNDPYYTGPDTASAQVKNANASIISNADTVLNTIEAVLKLTQAKTTSVEEAQRLKEQYAQSFKQKTSETQSISRDIWDSVDQETQKLILKAFGAEEAVIKKKIVVFK